MPADSGPSSPVELGRNHDASDLQVDCGSADIISRAPFARIPGRQPGQLRNEPVDRSTESASSIFQRVNGRRSSQFHNGTDYFKSEANRLSTFNDWLHQQTVRKADLARNGFIYTGSGDKVRCVFCASILHHWEPSDVVEQEHQRISPRCSLLLQEDVGNIPIFAANGHHHDTVSEPRPQASNVNILRGNNSCGQEHSEEAFPQKIVSRSSGTSLSRQADHVNPKMALEADRLASFSSWPCQMTQRPEQMAQSGLYYTGDSDKVTCFHCNVLLYNWEPSDDPFREHARWSPKCEYLRLVKGEKFIEDVQNHRMTDDEVMEMASVQAVLLQGSSKESVQRALTVLREKNVEMASVSAEILLKTIMELEESATCSASYSNGQVLPEDLRLLQHENESLRERQQCKICMEQDVEVIFYPCKHVVSCASCSAGISVCPICREPIQKRDKVFMS